MFAGCTLSSFYSPRLFAVLANTPPFCYALGCPRSLAPVLSPRAENLVALAAGQKKKPPQIPHIWWTGVREMSRTGVGGLAARPLRPLSCATEQGGRARLKPQQSAKRSSANREECVTVRFPGRATRRPPQLKVVPAETPAQSFFFVTHCRRLSNAVTATNVSDPWSLSAGDLPCQLCPLEEIHSDQQRVSVNQAALLLLFRCFNLELLRKVDGAAKRGRCEPACMRSGPSITVTSIA